MLKIKYLFTLLISLSILAACSDDDDLDTTPPVIEIVSPQDHAHFHPGENLQIHAILSDNKELAAWKIDIHYNYDSHTHSEVIALKNSDNDHHDEVAWHEDIHGTIEGGVRSYELTEDLLIPLDAKHGEYHLGIFVTDAAGNQSKVFVEIEIEDAD